MVENESTKESSSSRSDVNAVNGVEALHRGLGDEEPEGTITAGNDTRGSNGDRLESSLASGDNAVEPEERKTKTPLHSVWDVKSQMEAMTISSRQHNFNQGSPIPSISKHSTSSGYTEDTSSSSSWVMDNLRPVSPKKASPDIDDDYLLPSIEDIEAEVQDVWQRMRRLERHLNKQQLILLERHGEILRLRMDIVKAMMTVEAERKVANAELFRLGLLEGVDQTDNHERLNSSWPLMSSSSRSLQQKQHGGIDNDEEGDGEEDSESSSSEERVFNNSWPQMAPSTSGSRQRRDDMMRSSSRGSLYLTSSSHELNSNLSFQIHTIREELPNEGVSSDSASQHSGEGAGGSRSGEKASSSSVHVDQGQIESTNKAALPKHEGIKSSVVVDGDGGNDFVTYLSDDSQHNQENTTFTAPYRVPENRPPSTTATSAGDGGRQYLDLEPDSGRLSRWASQLSTKGNPHNIDKAPTSLQQLKETWKGGMGKSSDTLTTLDTKTSSVLSDDDVLDEQTVSTSTGGNS